MRKITIIFSLISSILSAQSFDLVPYRIQNKWGFSDSIGEIKITVKYDHVLPFSRKCAAFKLNGKWGLIDINGKETVMPTYDSVGMYFQGYYVIDKSTQKQVVISGIDVYQKGSLSYVDINGKSLYDKSKGPEILNIVDDDFEFTHGYKNKIEFTWKGNLVGYKIKKTGFFVKPQYDSLIYMDTDDYFFGDQPKAYFLAKKQGLWGIISTDNTILLPFKYDALLENSFNDKRKLFKKDQKWGVMNEKFEQILDNKYDSIVKSGGYIVKLKSKWGILDYQFKPITPIQYAKISLSEDEKGYYVTNSKNKTGFVNREGEMIIPEEYYDLKKYKYSAAFTYKNKKSDKHVGYLSADQKIRIPVKYRSIAIFRNGYSLIVNSKGKKGYINEKGFEYFKE